MQRPWLCAAAALASILLSLWAWHADPIINNDGTQYVRAAGYFLGGEWHQGFEVYKWPFYSMVTAATAKVTGLTAAQAAYGVNAALYVLLVWGFLALLQALGGEGRVLVLGAIVLLLHPSLNEYRSFVIRDIGFWAFYLWGLAYFFSHVRSGATSSLVLWAAATTLAALFRVEGLAFLVLLPFSLVAARTRGAVRWVVVAAAATVGALMIGSAVFWQHVPDSSSAASTLTERLYAGWVGVGRDVTSRLEALGREFPGHISFLVAWPTFLITLGWMVVVKIVRATSVTYSILVGYGLAGGRLFPCRRVDGYWWAVVAINLGYLCGFAFINFFLTDRYPFALGLTLLACVPFTLERLWSSFSSAGARRHVRWLAPALALLVLAAGIKGLSIDTNKYYLREAGLWLRAHMSTGSNLYSNERRVIYYAGAESAFRSGAAYSWDEAMHEIWSGRWRHYDYLALNVSHNDPERAQYVAYKLHRDPVKTFWNKDGDRVLIFEGRQPH